MCAWVLVQSTLSGMGSRGVAVLLLQSQKHPASRWSLDSSFPEGERATLNCGVGKALLCSRRALPLDCIKDYRSKAGKLKKQFNTALMKSCIKYFFECLLCVK